MLTETLRSFRTVGLGIKVVGAPIQPGSPGIFQLDVRRGRDCEYFRIWPGARDIDFAVLDGDARFRQVVLRVREPRRPYEAIVPKWSWRTPAWAKEEARRLGGETLRDTGRHWVFRLWTPDQERRYLCGFDERSLFIAQIRQGDTVSGAHTSLMPEEVSGYQDPLRVIRQGEWFFLPAMDQDLAALRDYVPTHPRSVRESEPLGPGGQPHVADEVVVIDRRERPRGREMRRREILARGRVRHPDHAELCLQAWHRVVRNRAVAPAGPDLQRLKWID